MQKKRSFAIFLFKIMPTCLLSRLFGLLVQVPLPRGLMNKLVAWYSKSYGVKTDEYIVPENGFKNFDQFFTRQLKPGVHTIDKNKKSIVSPVDARVDQYGDIKNSTLIQAKGLDYTIEGLIPSDTAHHFKNGSFMTLYLSPGDYHRIHTPVGGTITGYFNIPGALYTVQEYMVQGLPNLFVKNERLISYIQSDFGLVGVCKVGALNVGKMTLSYDDIITNKTFRRRKEVFYPKNEQKKIVKGAELGAFHLGSTIVLVFEKRVKFDAIKLGTTVRVGEKIAIAK